MKKWIPIAIVFTANMLIFACCCSPDKGKEKPEILIGKNLYISIPEDVIADASFVAKASKGEDSSFFKLMYPGTCDKLIEYMADNQLVIEPGLYIINQADPIDEVIEKIRFKKQDNSNF